MLNPELFAPIDSRYFEAFCAKIRLSPYNQLMGTICEEMRVDYARFRLPFRPQLNQSAGAINGGAIASLIDAAGVGATATDSNLPMYKLVTLDMNIQYLSAAQGEDIIGEAVVRRRGRQTINVSVAVAGSSSCKAVVEQ